VSIDEIMSILWRLLAVIFLVLLNGFFVAAEFSIVKIRETQLQPLLGRSGRARMAARIVKNLDASLSATQLGITLASLGLGWIGEPVFAAILEPVMGWFQIESAQVRHTISFAVGFSVITFLHIVLGELAPKSVAIQKPLPTTLWIAYPLHWFNKISFPFIWALNNTSLMLLRQIGIVPASEAELAHSEEELRLLLAPRHGSTDMAGIGRDIVLNAFDLRRRIAREVMRPRQQIVGLNSDAPLTQCLEVAEHTRFSRFPVLEHGNLDRALGFVHVKDLFAAQNNVRVVGELLPALKKLVYVPETARLERLLQVFLERKVHVAFVVDEYGGTVGLVTLENILEELVGQIQDEFDQETPLLVKKNENTWLVDGALPLHDLADVMNEPLDEEGITTASGWMTHRMGGFPKEGDVVRVGAYELRVEEMNGARVAKLSMRKSSEPVISNQ